MFSIENIDSTGDLISALERSIDRREATVYYVRSSVPLAPLFAKGVVRRDEKVVGEKSAISNSKTEQKSKKLSPTALRSKEAFGFGMPRILADIKERTMPSQSPYMVSVSFFANPRQLGKSLPYLLVYFHDHPPVRPGITSIPVAKFKTIGGDKKALISSLHNQLQVFRLHPTPASSPTLPFVLGQSEIEAFYLDPMVCLWNWYVGGEWPTAAWLGSEKINKTISETLAGFLGMVDVIHYVLTVPPIPSEETVRFQVDIEDELLPDATNVICHMQCEGKDDVLFEKVRTSVGDIITDTFPKPRRAGSANKARAPKMIEEMSFTYGAFLDAGQVFDYGECATLASRIWI
jgi:hypothetical protein